MIQHLHRLLRFVALFLVLSPFAAFAKTHLQVRSEESQWIVEEIGTATDGWPEVLERKYYPSQELAQQELLKLQKKSPVSSLTTLSLQPQMATGALWITTNQWSDEWENKYAAWIENEVSVDFFVENNIATDCADVAYSLRWVFSRIHGLPAANILGGSNVLMTNETVRSAWAKLPTAAKWTDDKRFRAALNYLLGLTYTHTLWDDSFPVALNRDALKSGSYNLNLHDSSGHTQVIHWLGANSGLPFLTLNSTVPRKVRQLMDSLLFADFPKKNETAILRFRWAVKNSSRISLLKASAMPGFSEEQYSFKSDKDFTIALFDKLGVPSEPESISEYLAKDIFELFTARIDIVKEGFAKCQKIDCKPGSAGYENWSTPSRDSRISGKISTYENLPVKEGSTWADKVVLDLEGTGWPLKSLIWNWKNSVYSSDPRDTVEARWSGGLHSWKDQQFQFLRSKLSEREKFLTRSESACRNKNCAYGTTLWEQHSSDKIDSELRDRMAYIKAGASQLPKDVVRLLQNSADENLYSLRGQAWTLGDFLLRSPQMSSNPKASFENQWGLQQKVFAVDFPSSWATALGDRWILAASSNSVVMDTQTGQSVDIDGKVVGLFSGRPWVAVIVAGELKVFDLESQAFKPATLPWASTAKAVMAKENYFAYFDGQETRVLQLNEQSQQWDLKETLAGKWSAVSSGLWLAKKAVGLYSVADHKLFPVSLETDEYNFFLADSYYFFGARLHPLIAIEKGTDKLIVTKTSGHLLWASKNFTHAVLMSKNGTQNFSVSKNLEFTSAEKLGDFCNNPGLSYIQCFSMRGGQMTFFSLDSDRVTPIRVPEGTRSINKNYFVAGTREEATLIERSTGRHIFKSPWLRLVGENYAFAKSSVAGYVHVLNLIDLANPYLTNVLKYKNYYSTDSYSRDFPEYIAGSDSGLGIWFRD